MLAVLCLIAFALLQCPAPGPQPEAPAPSPGVEERIPGGSGGQGDFLGQDVSVLRSMAEPLHGRDGYPVVHHAHYTVGYSTREEHPVWVAYTLTAAETKKRHKRSNQFRPDPSLPEMDVSTRDYSRTGYDRGHLAPAADMSFDKQAMLQSFYLSNVCPQLPGFNRGVWSSLEGRVRAIAWAYDSVYVVTGPLFRDTLGWIGVRRHIPVPSHFFKALLTPDLQHAVAFVLEHTSGRGANGRLDPAEQIGQGACSIDELEALSGLDLFPLLPDELEQRLEAQPPDLHVWGLAD